MTKAEKRHMDRVSALGCLACRMDGHLGTPAEIHHIREGQGMSQRASNFLVAPLCAAHHRTGGPGVAFHASPQRFEMLYGSELELLGRTYELLTRTE